MSTGTAFRLLLKDTQLAMATRRVRKLSAFGMMLAARAARQAKLVWNGLTFSFLDGIIVPQRNLSVTVENGSVWVTAGSRFLSRIRIKAMKNYSFPDGNLPAPEVLAGTVALAAREMKATKTGITLSLPRRRVITRTVYLPMTVKETIDQVVGYELDRLTPFNVDDAYFDFCLLGEKDGNLAIMVAAARRDWIDRYVDAFGKEGFAVRRLAVDVSGLAALCRYMGYEDCICVESDNTAVTVSVMRKNLLISSFARDMAGVAGEPDESAIAEALRPVVEEARADGIDAPAVVLCPHVEHGRLQDMLGTPVVELSDTDLKRRLACPEGPVSCSAAGALIESLWPRAQGFDLLRRGTRRRAGRPVLFSLVLICLILASWVPYILLPLETEKRKLAEIERQISIRKEEVRKVETLRKEVKAMTGEIATITDFKETKPMALVILKDLTTILPKSVWLTRIRMTETGVDLEGYAASASEILPKLEQSGYLKKVEFASPTVRDSRTNSDRFVIKAEIEGFGRQEGGRR